MQPQKPNATRAGFKTHPITDSKSRRERREKAVAFAGWGDDSTSEPTRSRTRPNTPQEPKREAFDDYEAYLEARASGRRIFASLRACKRWKPSASRKRHALNTRPSQASGSQDGEGSGTEPGDQPDMPVPRMPDSMRMAIVQTDVGPPTFTTLATTLQRLRACRPVTAESGTGLGKLELQLATKPVKASSPLSPLARRSPFVR